MVADALSKSAEARVDYAGGGRILYGEAQTVLCLVHTNQKISRGLRRESRDLRSQNNNDCYMSPDYD